MKTLEELKPKEEDYKSLDYNRIINNSSMGY